MFLTKLLISNLIIVTCVLVGRRWPGLGGLIATMPLTSLIVLLWLYSDDPGQTLRLNDYVQGVLWGIGPTIAFFAALLLCLKRGMTVPLALLVGALCWAIGAALHRLLLPTPS